MGMEVHKDGNGKLWLEFSMNIVRPVFIPLSFHYKFSSSIGPVYKEEKVMSRVSLVGGLLYVMKWLKPDVSHANNVVRYVTDSSVAMKWVLHRLRSTNVTYNGYTKMICDNCNIYFTGVFDRRRSITKYVSQYSCGRHVRGGVTPQEIQTCCKSHMQDHETRFIREDAVVLGFSWFAKKVMNKRKEQSIGLIVVKVEIVGIW
jgi:hypothetical protein